MKAIKSVLANRKMFRGGGLVPSRNEMVDLNAPSGILSSSMPLIDAVESDALSAEGGTALMSRGGYAHGGLHAPSGGSNTDALQDIDRVRQARVDYESGRISRADLNAVMDAVLQKHGGVRNLYAKLSPEQKEDPVVREVAFQLRPAPEVPDAPVPTQPPPSSEGLLPLDVSAAPEFDPSVAVPLDMGLNPNVPPELQPYLAQSGMRPVLERQIANMPQPVAPPPVDQPAVLTPIGPAPQIIAPEIQDAPSAMFEGNIDPNQGIVSAVAPPELQREETRLSGLLPSSAVSGIGDTVAENLITENLSGKIASVRPVSPVSTVDDYGGLEAFQSSEAPDALISENLISEKPYTLPDLTELNLGENTNIKEWNLRHRWGADDETIEEIMTSFPELDIKDIVEGNFSWKKQVADGPDITLEHRSEEEYQKSIQEFREAEEAEDITVAEEPTPTSGGVHPDTLAGQVLAEGEEVKEGEEDETVGVYEPGKLTDYLSGGGNYEEAPSDAVSRSVDSIIKDAISGIENKPFDKEALKAEIDAMLPMVEDDPEMEGYLIALMGASIMAGKDPNAWVNIGSGLEKSLPAFINFKSSQKEKQRDREMSIATLTLQTYLSRGEQDRQDIRALQTLGIQYDIDAAKTAAEKKKYRVQNNHWMAPELYGGDKPLYTPAGTTLTLNEAELTRATDAGLALLPWERGTWKLSDLVTDDTSWDSIKAAQDGGVIKQIELFQGIDKNPLKINYMTPSQGSLLAGGPSDNAIGISELQAAYSEYDRVRKPTLGLMEDINSIQQMVLGDPGAFSGPGLVGEQLQDAASALRGLPGSEAAISFIDGLRGKEFSGLSKMQQAQTRSVIILAKIAPLLLDESGKTISDADRRMIAQALGLTPVFNKDAGTWSIEITGQVFKNPENLVLAMNLTQQALTRRLNDVDDKMRTGLSKFGLPMIFDQETKEAFERIEKLRGDLGAEPIRGEDNPYTQTGQFEPIAITAADLSFNFATQ